MNGFDDEIGTVDYGTGYGSGFDFGNWDVSASFTPAPRITSYQGTIQRPFETHYAPMTAQDRNRARTIVKSYIKRVVEYYQANPNAIQRAAGHAVADSQLQEMYRQELAHIDAFPDAQLLSYDVGRSPELDQLRRKYSGTNQQAASSGFDPRRVAGTGNYVRGVGGILDGIGGIAGGGNSLWDTIITTGGEYLWGAITPDTTTQGQAASPGTTGTAAANTGGGMGLGVILLAGAALFFLAKKR